MTATRAALIEPDSLIKSSLLFRSGAAASELKLAEIAEAAYALIFGAAD